MIRRLFLRFAQFVYIVPMAFPQAGPVQQSALPNAMLMASQQVGNNLMVVLLDDVGSEHLEFMPHASATPASTPNLSSLAEQGILYDNFWSAPVCSPTRSMLLTGRYPHRTGIGNIIQPTDNFELNRSEVTIAEKMQARGYRTAMFGKWHLGYDPELPCDHGFEVWAGSIGNVSPVGCSGSCSYYDWDRLDDTDSTLAVASNATTYASQVTTDEAISFVQQQTQAWFCLVNYQDAHKPWEAPPGYVGPMDKVSVYQAKIAYLDSEVGRLIAALDLSNTTVILISDNGAPKGVSIAPNSAAKSKFSVYRGGIETACVMVGSAVDRSINLGHNSQGEVISGHASIVDIYRTVLKLQPNIGGPGGVPNPSDLDSVALYATGQGFYAPRDWNFMERFKPLGAPVGGPYELLRRAVEQDGYKLVLPDLGEARELYDVTVDPWETNDLLADGVSVAEQAILDQLDALLLSELGIQ